jgi:FkbM family methyltransferase
MNQFITYAQNGEDAILDAYFNDVAKGYYVDVGANHPTDDSVTKHFYDRGWHGINVEPIKEMFDLLVVERPEDINIKVGISDRHGNLKLREYVNSGLSTLSPDMKKMYEKNSDEKTAQFKDVVVPVITLQELFDENSVEHIHFMKVDVEGYEYEVLLGNDWSKYRPEMICIESNHQVKDWRPILKNNSYTKVWNDGLNDYYLAKESLRRKDNFSYAEDMLTDKQVIPHHIFDHIVSLLDEVQLEKIKNQAASMRVDRLINDNNELLSILLKERRPRYALVNLIVGIDKAILAQINRLQKPSRRKPRVAPYKNLEYESVTARELLSIIDETDTKSYYSQKKVKRTKKSVAHRITKHFYLFMRHTGASSTRTILRLSRKRKNK